MSSPSMQIVYEIHTTEFDIELVDTRRRGYRAASGRLRPFLTFVFAPVASLTVAFRLTADRADRRSIAALLYVAITQAADQQYGGVPDEVRIYESAAQFELPLRCACDTLGIPLRSRGCGHHATGEAERFPETLHKRVGETLAGYVGTVLGNGTAHPTLHELEDVLKQCLAEYHCSINSDTGQSPLAFWQTHCFPDQADPQRLARLLGKGILGPSRAQGSSSTHGGTGIMSSHLFLQEQGSSSIPPLLFPYRRALRFFFRIHGFAQHW